MPSWTDRLRTLDDRVLGRERTERPVPPWLVPVMCVVMLLLAVTFAIAGNAAAALISVCVLVGLGVGATYARHSQK